MEKFKVTLSIDFADEAQYISCASAAERAGKGFREFIRDAAIENEELKHQVFISENRYEDLVNLINHPAVREHVPEIILLDCRSVEKERLNYEFCGSPACADEERLKEEIESQIQTQGIKQELLEKEGPITF